MSAGGDRKIVFALLGIGILCLIGLGASLYHGKATELKELQTALGAKETELEEMQTQVTQLPQLEEQYQDLRGRLSVLEPGLPDSAYIPTFLRQIESLASGTRNDILLIRPKPAIKQSAADSAVSINNETGEIIKDAEKPAGAAPAPPPMPYDFVPIELRVQGTYWTVIDFLAELQRFPKMIAVNDISFSPNQGGLDSGRSPNLTASMELTAVVTKGGSDGRSA
ncbi:MAG: type 4a pilus biogenesis protein PilO [Armatimonadetes bacterium]|nr:type 4a pilus biogenesis protein PilO [Armatimonadota bacterium]